MTTATPSTTVSAPAPAPAASVRSTRSCLCGKAFVPPVMAPAAKLCRACHKAAQNKEAERQASLRALRDRQAEALMATAALQEAFRKGELPKSATVRKSGRQVVVCWMGRSTTFYEK